ncbi:MAG: MerR family transcriptional regulator [Rhodospirillales bacterium]|nr:MAG: MerR family transcriptional regulator [Rhodospirillales bacterium]
MGKSEAAFRTISEVAEELDVPQHVLRFWEGRFNQIKPLKRAGGRRYYRPEDVELLKRIREMLYGQGYTIKGVQKLLRDKSGEGAGLLAARTPATAPPPLVPVQAREEASAQLSLLPTMAKPDVKTALGELLAELTDIRDMLVTATGTRN